MSTKTLCAIVLAAGRASRYGSTKQLALLDGEALVARAVRTAERLCGQQTLLVTGNDWINVAAACEPLQGFMVRNPRYRDGLSTSLAQGVRSVRHVAGGVLLMLADQPLVDAAQLQTLIDTWRATPDAICASSYAGTTGPPVIFPARFYADLTKLRGDRGARAVIEANSDQVISISFEKAAIDIDTPGDLRKL